MSFYEIVKEYENYDFNAAFDSFNSNDVLAAINKEILSVKDFLCLLSPAASANLSEIAKKANVITKQNFGKVVLLFTPIYVADYCVNECIYCSFNVKNIFNRRKLTMDELESEAKAIAATGLKHVLILTGESREHSSVYYIEQCTKVLSQYFTSVSIEVYPMDTDEYRQLIEAGIDGLTIYQEVYDREIYEKLHLSGPKRDYIYRLDAPERGASAGMRTVSIGALLGLNDFRRESFHTGLHAQYLQKKFWDLEVGVSLPRFRPHLGQYQPTCVINDKDFVQVLLALRMFLPRCGISVSTRESASFREKILPLGITKMSAGVSTNVGGHTVSDDTKSQFEISDKRSVSQVKEMLEEKGYQPIFVDWR